MFIGVDIGIKSDNAAVAGVRWDVEAKKIVIANHRGWRPTKSSPVNLAEVHAYIEELAAANAIMAKW